MKYLKRINESLDNIEYIRFCFADILDNDKFKTYESESNIHGSGTYFMITIEPIKRRPNSGNPEIGSWTTSIDELVKEVDNLKELYLDIDTAINRLLDKYKNIYTIKTNRRGVIFINILLK